MKIEAGKYYKTRDGRKVGPMVVIGCEDDMGHEYVFSDGDGRPGRWNTEGEDGNANACERFSRSNLIAEWSDPIDLSNPHGTAFGLLPPEVQEAMKAAYEAGALVEFFNGEEWDFPRGPVWVKGYTYRIKPAPKRETVTLYASKGDTWAASWSRMPDDTHRLTFDVIDGEPQPGKWEKL